MIRVLLVDDQPLVRGGFAAILDAADDIEIVGAAPCLRQAIRLVRGRHRMSHPNGRNHEW